MTFWPMLSYLDIFNFLMFYPSELGSKDPSDYKNIEAYSYYKSGQLQPLQYHNLSGYKYCIIRRRTQKISVNKGSTNFTPILLRCCCFCSGVAFNRCKEISFLDVIWGRFKMINVLLIYFVNLLIDSHMSTITLIVLKILRYLWSTVNL